MADVTLLFLRRNSQVLLAMKKRGFGAGKWDGAADKQWIPLILEGKRIHGTIVFNGEILVSNTVSATHPT